MEKILLLSMKLKDLKKDLYYTILFKTIKDAGEDLHLSLNLRHFLS